MRRILSVGLLAALACIAAIGAVAAAGLATVNHLEARDRFCIACHLPDGTPLHRRKLDLALQRPGLDLAGVHLQRARVDQGPFTCADCHRGVGWRGRAAVLWDAAGDTLRYYTGAYHEPEHLTRPIANQACTGCHRDVTHAGNPHRFHGLDAHRAQTMIRCTACHPAHARWTQPVREAQYVRQTARIVCGRCHKGNPPSPVVQHVLQAYQQALRQRMEHMPVAAALQR